MFKDEIEFKNKILDLLTSDAEVIEKIKNLKSEKSEKIIDNENEKLKRKLVRRMDLLKKIIRLFKAEKQELKNSKDKERGLEKLNSDLKIENETNSDKLFKSKLENEDFSKRLELYETQFNDLLQIHEKYNGLSEKTRGSLSGIFKSESIIGIISCGVQEENLNSLWDYIKDKIKEEKYEDIENLKGIFQKLFDIYILSNPKYERQDVKKDDFFDFETHIRHSSGRVNGKIEEIMLLGYINKKNGQVIKKSLVKVY
ncbi:MAG: hypothetical protein ACRCTS_07020 [Fusobacteriaceae bacterium]